MLIILVSFLSGILSVLAPCVLPVIPVIFGGGLAGGSNGRTLRILLAAMTAIFVFTFLLKVSTAFIAIPTSTWSIISGVIILLYGLTLVFPNYWLLLSEKLPKISPSTKNSGKGGDYILGASLGPIFATCSPTYSLLLATILPASPFLGVAGLLAYLVGFGGFLYILIQGGRGLIKKFYRLADNNGVFKKVLGVVLIITGLLICTGYMKKIEATLIEYVPDSGRIESLLIEKIHK